MVVGKVCERFAEPPPVVTTDPTTFAPEPPMTFAPLVPFAETSRAVGVYWLVEATGGVELKVVLFCGSRSGDLDLDCAVEDPYEVVVE